MKTLQIAGTIIAKVGNFAGARPVNSGICHPCMKRRPAIQVPPLPALDEAPSVQNLKLSEPGVLASFKVCQSLNEAPSFHATSIASSMQHPCTKQDLAFPVWSTRAE